MRDVIEAFFNELKPTKYLEIGLGDGVNFESVPLEEKVCISPSGSVNTGVIYNYKSRDFFRKYYGGIEKYDISCGRESVGNNGFDLIFIDGDHEYVNTMMDIIHCFDYLSAGGVILVHDVNPLDLSDEASKKIKPDNGRPWCGDCWKCVWHVKFCFDWCGYATIGEFPGWLCLWRLKEKRIFPKWPVGWESRFGGLNLYPYTTFTIDDARRWRGLFEFGMVDQAIEKYRKDHS